MQIIKTYNTYQSLIAQLEEEAKKGELPPVKKEALDTYKKKLEKIAPFREHLMQKIKEKQKLTQADTMQPAVASAPAPAPAGRAITPPNTTGENPHQNLDMIHRYDQFRARVRGMPPEQQTTEFQKLTHEEQNAFMYLRQHLHRAASMNPQPSLPPP